MVSAPKMWEEYQQKNHLKYVLEKSCEVLEVSAIEMSAYFRIYWSKRRLACENVHVNNSTAMTDFQKSRPGYLDIILRPGTIFFLYHCRGGSVRLLLDKRMDQCRPPALVSLIS